jgi:hypothetical protein
MIDYFFIDGQSINYFDMSVDQIKRVLKEIEKIRQKGITITDEQTGYIKTIKYSEIDQYFNVKLLKDILDSKIN